MARRSQRTPTRATESSRNTYHKQDEIDFKPLEIRTEPYSYYGFSSTDKEVNTGEANTASEGLESAGEAANTVGDRFNLISEGIDRDDTDRDVLVSEDRLDNSKNYGDAIEDKSKKAWSDVDDELYIQELLSQRTSEVRVLNRDKRDSVVNSEEMWDFPSDLTDCDCLGPPPEFFLPPPPRPPFLQTDYYCGEDPIADLETCDSEPKINAYNHSSPSLQTSAAIALCSIVLVLGIFIGGMLFWKHKRKATNLFPSKTSSISSTNATTAQCRLPSAPAPLYEDLDLPRRAAISHQRSPQCEPQLEMVERKRPTGCAGGGRVFVCGSGGTWRGGACGGDTCGAPLYEELPRRPSEESLPGSEEHFAEDELSLVGEKGLPCRQCVQHSLPHRNRPPRYDRRPRSLERRRAAAMRNHHPEMSEFHEGVLLDALLRLYPNVGTVGTRARPAPNIGCGGGAWPGDIPLGHPRAPRVSPKPPSQDSSFGSDSGYSNNTCGTCGTRGSGRNRYSTAEIGMS